MDRAGAEALLGRVNVVHLAATTADGEPVLRTLHAVVVRGGLCFHGAPAGEKTEAIGRPAVVGAEEVVAAIPSYFLDPERACPATTLYRSAQVHGVIERVEAADYKAEVLQALMEKHQAEGGHVPIRREEPRYDELYRKAVNGIMVLRVSLERLDGKAKLAQNRTPAEQARLLEKLWERGLSSDPAAIEAVRGANPGLPLPAFLRGPGEITLAVAPGEDDAKVAAGMLEGAYWNVGIAGDVIGSAHLGSSAWVGARDGSGRLVGTARAVSDGAKRAWIFDVMVAPEHRAKGVGEAVLRLLLDHPAVRRTREVLLRTRDAEGFYRRFGFALRGEARAVAPSIEMVRFT